MAREVARKLAIPLLDLDAIAFGEVTVRRPLAESLVMLHEFIAAHLAWVIEGCYGSLIEAALPHCSELRFLNPGVEVCVANCCRRPWEPHKYASPEGQDERLAFLITWVRQYPTRDDEYSLACHRALFDAFQGIKREYVEIVRIS